ncbi:MAG: hypothetical protein OXC40_04035, partial [Proteobacteria bacterium]|nr:hypothetical protein [Pseudomonadota bacterium]
LISLTKANPGSEFNQEVAANDPNKIFFLISLKDSDNNDLKELQEIAIDQDDLLDYFEKSDPAGDPALSDNSRQFLAEVQQLLYQQKWSEIVKFYSEKRCLFLTHQILGYKAPSTYDTQKLQQTRVPDMSAKQRWLSPNVKNTGPRVARGLDHFISPEKLQQFKQYKSHAQTMKTTGIDTFHPQNQRIVKAFIKDLTNDGYNDSIFVVTDNNGVQICAYPESE